jgi:hypothetical protein
MVAHPTGLSRHVRRACVTRLDPHVTAAAALPGANRYRKHFHTAAHLWILLRHALSGSPSLSQTHARLDWSPTGWQDVGLKQRVSFSQLARSTTSRPSACLEHLAAALLAQVPARRADPVLAQVWARDSSFFTLSAKLSPWSCHGRHVPGIRLHTDFDFTRSVPAALHWTTADTHDLRHLAETDLTELAGWTVVLDVGYYGHALFQHLRDHGVDFICPRQPQARLHRDAEEPVGLGMMTPNGDIILGDAVVTLGSPHNRASAVLPQLRLITSLDPSGGYHELVTSRHDLDAKDVVMLYHQRWQIELFFRAVKHQLGTLRPLGTSAEAVWATILLGVILWALLALLETIQPPSISNVAWLRAIDQNLTDFLRLSG